MTAKQLIYIVLIAVGFVSSICTGQKPPHYETAGELVGAAATGPRLSEEVLVKVSRFCYLVDKSLERVGNRTIARWRDRHASYLKVSLFYYRALETRAKNTSDVAERNDLMEFLNEDYKVAVGVASRAAIMPIQAANDESGQNGIVKCREYFKAVDQGEHDVRTRDPELASFLERGIPHVDPNSGNEKR